MPWARDNLTPAASLQHPVDGGLVDLLSDPGFEGGLDLHSVEHPSSTSLCQEWVQERLFLLWRQIGMPPPASWLQVEDGLTFLGPARVDDMLLGVNYLSPSTTITSPHR